MIHAPLSDSERSFDQLLSWVVSKGAFGKSKDHLLKYRDRGVCGFNDLPLSFFGCFVHQDIQPPNGSNRSTIQAQGISDFKAEKRAVDGLLEGDGLFMGQLHIQIAFGN